MTVPISFTCRRCKGHDIHVRVPAWFDANEVAAGRPDAESLRDPDWGATTAHYCNDCVEDCDSGEGYEDVMTSLGYVGVWLDGSVELHNNTLVRLSTLIDDVETTRMRGHLLRAIALARDAAYRTEDRGTCCMDMVAVKDIPGVDIAALLDDVGLRGHLRETPPGQGPGMWDGYWLVSPPYGGQANRRMMQMQAMVDCLRGLGYEVMGYYQMD